MTTFSDLKFGPHRADPSGKHALVFFPNGYGASVVRFRYSYGGDRGLYELGVISGNEADWSLCYDTPITEDVLGHLSEADVSRLLSEIEALPTKSVAAA